MNYRTLTFVELRLDHVALLDLPARLQRAEIIQVACDYLMDKEFPEFNEPDVIGPYDYILVCWLSGTVSVPIRKVYKPEYLH